MVVGHTGRHHRGGRRAGGSGRRPRPVCITHQRESFVCLDSDRRCRCARPFSGSMGAPTPRSPSSARVQVHELSGKPPDTDSGALQARLAVPARARRSSLMPSASVDVQAYLALQLTGRWATSVGIGRHPRACSTFAAVTWSPSLLDLAGVRVEQLPDLVPAARSSVRHPLGGRSLARPARAGASRGRHRRRPGRRSRAWCRSCRVSLYLNLGTSMVHRRPSRTSTCGTRPFRTLAGIGSRHIHVRDGAQRRFLPVATWCRRAASREPPRADGARSQLMEAAAGGVPIGAEGAR